MTWLQLGLLVRDMLHAGSGKLGTSNSICVLGRPTGVLVFLADLAKGLLASLFPWPDAAWHDLALGAAGAAAIAGHNWSVWVRLLSTAAWGLVVLAGFGDSLRRFVRGEEPRVGAASLS